MLLCYDLLCLLWFVVFWLAPAIPYLQIWLRIHFPPESVVWQFTYSNDQYKSRVFLRLIAASSPVLLSFTISKEERIQFLSVVTRHGNCYTLFWLVTRDLRFDPAFSKERVCFYCVISQTCLSLMKIYCAPGPVLLTGDGPVSWVDLNLTRSKMP